MNSQDNPPPPRPYRVLPPDYQYGAPPSEFLKWAMIVALALFPIVVIVALLVTILVS